MSELIFMMCLSMGGLDCPTMVAVAKVESNLNPRAVGRSHGELGLFQLRPNFHKCATFDPIDNIECGLNYMKRIKKRHYKQHGKCYITFYNTGPNAKLDNPCKHRYYKKVRSNLK